MSDRVFELTQESKEHFGVKLYRIRALVDLPRHGVRKGDLGGWIASVDNLRGDAWVSGNARVFDGARVYGNARVSGNADLTSYRHILTVNPIGSEEVTATLHRVKDGGHVLHVGCWTNGSLGDLEAEVERRAQYWGGTEADHAVWRAQYSALKALGEATVSGWEQ